MRINRLKLKKFLEDNKLIGTMAGVAVAFHTKDLILSFSGDIFVPIIHKILLSLHIEFLRKLLPNDAGFNITKFIQNVISWIIGILVVFVFIYYVNKYILGIKTDDD